MLLDFGIALVVLGMGLVVLPVAKALLFRCVICRKGTWLWQECEPSRFSDTMDEVHRLCREATCGGENAGGGPLSRAASA